VLLLLLLTAAAIAATGAVAIAACCLRLLVAGLGLAAAVPAWCLHRGVTVTAAQNAAAPWLTLLLLPLLLP